MRYSEDGKYLFILYCTIYNYLFYLLIVFYNQFLENFMASQKMWVDNEFLWKLRVE